MTQSSGRADGERVLVSDFDGTMTQRDFYRVYVERLLPPDAPDFWQEYRAGRLTHFEALAAIFAYVPAGEAALLALTTEMNLEPELPGALAALRDTGWQVVVVSAGCRWYIDRLLAKAGVALELHANDGHVDAGGRLVMTRPTADPFHCREVGIDKAAAVRTHLSAGRTVAFAGDGPPDVPPALLVPAALRFARGDLAAMLKERGESYRPFTRWRDVAESLSGKAVSAKESTGGPR